MEILKKTSDQPVFPRKRPLDECHESNDSNLEKSKTRKMVSKFPPPKIRTEKIVRSFPPGCGIKENYQFFRNDHNVLKNIKPGELKGNKSYLGSGPARKVMFYDPRIAQKPKVTTTVVSRKKPTKMVDNADQSSENNELKTIKRVEFGRKKAYFGFRSSGKEQVRREKIKQALTMFDEVYARLFQANRLQPKEEKTCPLKITMEVAKIVKQNLKWLTNVEKVLGSVCGVRVGDKFRFRSQLKMVGVHCQAQAGIDYIKIGGKNLAVSIVDSHRYSNERKSFDKLIYCGHGGLERPLGDDKVPPEDQQLERGNLALKNSMFEKNPVRVIRKIGGGLKNMVFVYDGLYIVKDCELKKGEEGNMVFKFKLNRVPGQPELLKSSMHSSR